MTCGYEKCIHPSRFIKEGEAIVASFSGEEDGVTPVYVLCSVFTGAAWHLDCFKAMIKTRRN